MGASQPQRSHPPPNDPSWLFPFYMSHLFLLVVPCVKQGLCQTPVNERECKWAKAQGQLTTASYSSRPSYVCLPIIQSVIIRCIYVGLSSVQFSRPVMSNSLWPRESQYTRPPLFITNSRSLLKLIPIESVMPSSHLILCRSLLLMPPIPPSISVFSNESALHMRCPKYWSFSFSISPSNEHPELISFRIDWFDLLAVQGTLKSLLQHYSSKASIFWHSAFFTVQLSHPYMTTGKTIALTRPKVTQRDGQDWATELNWLKVTWGSSIC